MALFFFFNDTATTEIYTLSLHDALPIFSDQFAVGADLRANSQYVIVPNDTDTFAFTPRAQAYLERSEEHTSELQSPCNLVCRLLLEKITKQPSRALFGLRKQILGFDDQP